MVTAQWGMGIIVFRSEQACPSGPALCLTKVLGQIQLSGWPLFMMVKFPHDDYLLEISNTSHCSNPLCLSGHRLHCLRPCFPSLAGISTCSVHTLCITVPIAGLHSMLAQAIPSQWGNQVPPSVPSHAAANGCILRNNGWRKQQKPSSCYGVLTDEFSSSF